MALIVTLDALPISANLKGVRVAPVEPSPYGALTCLSVVPEDKAGIASVALSIATGRVFCPTFGIAPECFWKPKPSRKKFPVAGEEVDSASVFLRVISENEGKISPVLELYISSLLNLCLGRFQISACGFCEAAKLCASVLTNRYYETIELAVKALDKRFRMETATKRRIREGQRYARRAIRGKLKIKGLPYPLEVAFAKRSADLALIELIQILYVKHEGFTGKNKRGKEGSG